VKTTEPVPTSQRWASSLPQVFDTPAGGQFPPDVDFLKREVGEFLGRASGARRD
jgi:hypothetical protein